MTARRSNLGTTRLRRRRTADPMRLYNSLPPDLRRWMAAAALPWSPASCRRLWQEALASGAAADEALARLDRAERATLRREAAGAQAIGNAAPSA